MYDQRMVLRRAPPQRQDNPISDRFPSPRTTPMYDVRAGIGDTLASKNHSPRCPHRLVTAPPPLPSLVLRCVQ